MSHRKMELNFDNGSPVEKKAQLYASEINGNIHQFEMKDLVHFSYLENNLHQNIKAYTEYTEAGTSRIDFSALVEEGRTKPHKHNYYEVNVIMEGTAFVNIDGKQYTFDKGDCYIVNQNIEHYELLTSDFSTFYIHLSNEMVENLLKYEGYRCSDEKASHNSIWQFLVQQKEGVQKKERNFLFLHPCKDIEECMNYLLVHVNTLIIDYANREPGYLFLTASNLCKLFHTLDQKEFYTSTYHRQEAGPTELLFVRLIQEIAYSGGQISWETLREKLNYSPEYLNKVMRRFTGMTINQYAMNLRMESAAQELIRSETRIDEIAEKNGFSNRTYFYKCFAEKYSCTPRQYRDRYGQSQDR